MATWGKEGRKEGRKEGAIEFPFPGVVYSVGRVTVE